MPGSSNGCLLAVQRRESVISNQQIITESLDIYNPGWKTPEWVAVLRETLFGCVFFNSFSNWSQFVIILNRSFVVFTLCRANLASTVSKSIKKKN